MMMQTRINPAPRLRDVLLEQIRLVGIGLRREGLVAALVIGGAATASAVEFVRGHDMTTWFDAHDWVGIAVVSFLIPFAVWRRERRYGPAFLWTLPVDRRTLALARVAAGWVWLMAGLAVLIGWMIVLASVSDVPMRRAIGLFPGPFTVATAMYLLGSALALGLRRPLVWLVGTVVVCALVANFSEALERSGRATLDSPRLTSAIEHVMVAWDKRPDPSRWAVATLIWLGAGAAALFAASSRHREHRRR